MSAWVPLLLYPKPYITANSESNPKDHLPGSSQLYCELRPNKDTETLPRFWEHEGCNCNLTIVCSFHKIRVYLIILTLPALKPSSALNCQKTKTYLTEALKEV